MTSTRTGDQLLVREINLSIILNTLRSAGALSRAALALRTGLNKTTVSSLVSELLGARFVREVGLHGSHGGRPGMLVEMNPDAGCIVAAEVGADFISVLLTNFNAQVIWRFHDAIRSPLDEKATLRRTMQVLKRAELQAERHHLHILGIALGVPGLVDVSSGLLLFAPNLRWREVPLKQILERKFAYPIFVDNEANLAALGESYFGVGRGHRNMLYVSAGVGLGGGVVMDGRVLSGAAGFAGEFGHMTMLPDGIVCNCGNRGCWETLASQSALFCRVRAALEAGSPSCLTHLTQGDLDKLTIPLITEAAREADPVALAALEETGLYLGIGIANLINALNPEIVVFGGILSHASAFLLPTIRRVIQERTLIWSRRAVQVVVAAHGSDACMMGGIATVYQHILSQPKALHRMVRARAE